MTTRIIFGLIIISTLCSSPGFAQKAEKKRIITGIVTDPDKKPLPDVKILIDRKNADCSTNKNGYYKIKVKAGDKTLTAFSDYNGMKEVPIEGKTTIDFELFKASPTPIIENQNKRIDETVNVGYGSMKKKDMSTNVSQVDAQNPKFSSYTNIYDMIKHSVPGVRVEGTSIYVVEPSSLNASNEPLILVDGTPVSSLDGIEPNMVKSISVLKGASATIYGTRAAHGVILITLMRGAKK